MESLDPPFFSAEVVPSVSSVIPLTSRSLLPSLGGYFRRLEKTEPTAGHPLPSFLSFIDQH